MVEGGENFIGSSFDDGLDIQGGTNAAGEISYQAFLFSFALGFGIQTRAVEGYGELFGNAF